MELDYFDYLEIKGYLAYWLARHIEKLFRHSMPELILSSLVGSHVLVAAATWGLPGLSLGNGAA